MTRKRTRFVFCDRHRPWFEACGGRARQIECLVEGGPGGWSPGCEGGRCRLWPGTDTFEASICTGEMEAGPETPLAWTLGPRAHAFAALLEEYDASPNEYDEGEEEDPRPFLNGEQEPSRFVCVTINYSSHGYGKHFFLPTFDDQAAAEARAVEFADDDIFEELPVEVRDLDTGASFPAHRTVGFGPKEPLVIVVRDPDASNEYATFAGSVRIHDVDCGRADLSDPDEYREWAASHEESAAALAKDGYAEAAEYLRQVVADYGPDGGR